MRLGGSISIICDVGNSGTLVPALSTDGFNWITLTEDIIQDTHAIVRCAMVDLAAITQVNMIRYIHKVAPVAPIYLAKARSEVADEESFCEQGDGYRDVQLVWFLLSLGLRW